jgi:hypothetical protein
MFPRLGYQQNSSSVGKLYEVGCVFGPCEVMDQCLGSQSQVARVWLGQREETRKEREGYDAVDAVEGMHSMQRVVQGPVGEASAVLLGVWCHGRHRVLVQIKKRFCGLLPLTSSLIKSLRPLHVDLPCKM